VRLASAPCEACGQPVLREPRRFRAGVRVACGDDCKATLAALDAGSRLEMVGATCLACGEEFLAPCGHIGLACRGGGVNLCPSCWRERVWEAELAQNPYLNSMASVVRAVRDAFALAARVWWEPRLACPRCGDLARGPYEWSCRYPLAVGLCEGLEGPHVHSVCQRCGYETVRLQTKKAPGRGKAVGAPVSTG